MRSKNYLITGALLLALGLGALLSRPRAEGKPDESGAPDGSVRAAATDEPASCPRGQLDDFGVCVPVAQTPPRAHVGSATQATPNH